MKIVTIGGLPAAGKTYTSKILAQKYNCISIEFEGLRWNYFNSNLDKNLYNYTNYEKFLPKENMRDYYLRCTLFEMLVPLKKLINWHINAMNYFRNIICNCIDEFILIKNENDYIKLCEKYSELITYKPSYKQLNKDMIICSHAFINTLNFYDTKRIRIDFDSSDKVLFKRFMNREKITLKIDKNLKYYYDSYREVLNRSNAIKIDNTKKNFESNILKVLNNI